MRIVIAYHIFIDGNYDYCVLLLLHLIMVRPVTIRDNYASKFCRHHSGYYCYCAYLVFKKMLLCLLLLLPNNCYCLLLRYHY